MKWQEYQEAVALLYEQTEGFGAVSRNVYVPDKVTEQPRQIDVLIELEAKGHEVKVVIDAKFFATPIDVRDVESVVGLAESVGASKSIIVTANGWTKPAQKKAEFSNCDLRILNIEDALDLIVPDKWRMCPSCKNDCLVLDQDGALTLDDGSILWWLAGQCRSCKHAFAWCQDCGTKMDIGFGVNVECECGYGWHNTSDGIVIHIDGVKQ